MFCGNQVTRGVKNLSSLEYSGIHTRRKCNFFQDWFRRLKSAYLAYLGQKFQGKKKLKIFNLLSQRWKTPFSPEKSRTYVSCKSRLHACQIID